MVSTQQRGEDCSAHCWISFSDRYRYDQQRWEDKVGEIDSSPGVWQMNEWRKWADKQRTCGSLTLKACWFPCSTCLRNAPNSSDQNHPNMQWHRVLPEPNFSTPCWKKKSVLTPPPWWVPHLHNLIDFKSLTCSSLLESGWELEVFHFLDLICMKWIEVVSNHLVNVGVICHGQLDIAKARQLACGVITTHSNSGTALIAKKESAAILPEYVGVKSWWIITVRLGPLLLPTRVPRIDLHSWVVRGGRSCSGQFLISLKSKR